MNTADAPMIGNVPQKKAGGSHSGGTLTSQERSKNKDGSVSGDSNEPISNNLNNKGIAANTTP